MGADALQGNGVTQKILYLIRDRHLTPASEPLRKVRTSRIILFTVIQLIGFGATFAIVQTIGRVVLYKGGLCILTRLCSSSVNWFPHYYSIAYSD